MPCPFRMYARPRSASGFVRGGLKQVCTNVSGPSGECGRRVTAEAARLLHADETQVHGVLIHCTNCGSYNSPKDKALRELASAARGLRSLAQSPCGSGDNLTRSPPVGGDIYRSGRAPRKPRRRLGPVVHRAGFSSVAAAWGKRSFTPPLCSIPDTSFRSRPGLHRLIILAIATGSKSLPNPLTQYG